VNKHFHRSLTMHFTDMCIPHFFSLPNVDRRTLFGSEEKCRMHISVKCIVNALKLKIAGKVLKLPAIAGSYFEPWILGLIIFEGCLYQLK
jgi:hypothetical protein